MQLSSLKLSKFLIQFCHELKIKIKLLIFAADIPFISYYVINTKKTDPDEFFRGLRVNSLRRFDPAQMRYTASHTMDLFNEVATIARPPLHEPGTKPDRPSSTGYIICIYKVFDGDDGEKFEKNWLYWTGA